MEYTTEERKHLILCHFWKPRASRLNITLYLSLREYDTAQGSLRKIRTCGGFLDGLRSSYNA